MRRPQHFASKAPSKASKRTAAIQYAHMAVDPTIDAMMRMYSLTHREAERILIEAKQARGMFG